MNAYGTLLKKLIRFTNIKLTNLAEIVGYDTSYISKWSLFVKLDVSKTLYFCCYTSSCFD